MLVELRMKTYRQSTSELDNDYQLEKLREEWLKSRAQERRASTVRRYQQDMNNVFWWLTVTSVAHLTCDLLEEFPGDRLSDGVSSRMVNMDAGALSTMLNWGVERKKIGSNPIASLKPLAHNAKEARH